jgi:hypothetical protein
MAEPDPTTDPPADPGDGDGKYVTHEQLDGKIDPLSDKVDKILGFLGDGKGKPEPGTDDPAAGKSIADQVREGVEQLERERAAKAAADQDAADAKAAKETTEERLARLERKPREPAGKVRTAVQRFGLGIRETGR